VLALIVANFEARFADRVDPHVHAADAVTIHIALTALRAMLGGQ